MRKFRNRRRPHTSVAPLSHLQRIAQGEGGERTLQDWLDRSALAYLFLDQTPITMPTSRRRDIKRPDFLVAIDGMGTIALDAKAKTISNGRFLLEASERRRLAGFQAHFGIPVWYACFPPQEPGVCHLFRNSDLIGAAVTYDPRRQVILVPVSLGLAVQHMTTFFTHAIHLAARHRRP